MKLIVGIDFGTSTTVVRYRLEGSKELYSLKDANGTSDVIPSLIFRNEEYGTTEYGIQAETSALSGISGTTIANFKMDLLDPAKREQAKLYIEEFLKYLHGLFEAQTKGLVYDLMDVNVSYPAKWDDEMVRIMKDLVASAGFKGIIHGRKEPEAAARNMLNCHLGDLKQSKMLSLDKPLRIFMLDMGAGTTDISIFKLSIDKEGIPAISEMLSYPSIQEKILCGGREIDTILKNYIVNFCNREANILAADQVEIPLIKQWKETIASSQLRNDSPVSIPAPIRLILKMMNHPEVSDKFKSVFNRSEFEHATREHWEKLYKLIVTAMSQYSYAKAEDIDFVCLTGGHSAWYTLPRLFTGEGIDNSVGIIGKDQTALNFKKLHDEPWRMSAVIDALPHESVARGLCLMDEKIEYATRSANNVWARMSFNGQTGETIQIVDKINDILPAEKEVKIETSYDRNYVFGDVRVDAKIELFTGETLEDADHRILTLSIDPQGGIGRIISALFILPLFTKLQLDTSISMKITMTEEGLIQIAGTFTVDNESAEFTFDDLQLTK